MSARDKPRLTSRRPACAGRELGCAAVESPAQPTLAASKSTLRRQPDDIAARVHRQFCGPARRDARQNGFVLVIVLTLLVVLSLLATATATTAARAIAMAQADADRFQSELDRTSSRETVMFMVATQRQTIAGLTTNSASILTSAVQTLDADADGFSALPLGHEIRLDGTPYHGIGNTLFALQDDAGLLSINWSSPILTQAFFQSLGVPASQWNALEAKRLDYQDPDDLHRLNGAEREHYEKAGMPPPANRTLSTPLELRRVMGWNKVLEARDDAQLLSTLTLARSTRLNINTAPLEVLETLPGMTPNHAQRMIEVRHAVPFASASQVQQTFGIAVGEEWLTLFAIPSGNLILWDRHSGARHLLHWTMTPMARAGPPWRIDYEVTLPRGAKSAPIVAGTPATPLFPAQDPAG